MFAYVFRDKNPDDARRWLRTTRLSALSGWTFADSGYGALAFQPGWSMESSAPPRDTPEGWHYLGPKVRQDVGQFLRRHRPETATVELSNGQSIEVPLAAKPPRSVTFDPINGGALGFPKLDWVQGAWQLWETNGSATIGQIAAVIGSGLGAVYAVTTEMLNDCVDISENDLVSILVAMWGFDPKAVAGAGGVSRSVPAEVPATCP